MTRQTALLAALLASLVLCPLSSDAVAPLAGGGPARSVASATTIVDVASATAPAAGQMLTATSSTAATWQDPPAGTWSSIAAGSVGCTRTDDDTVSIADAAANVALVRPGIPFRGADAIGSWRYAIVTTVTDVGATLTVDLTGAAITAAYDAYCQFGAASLVERDLITDPGQFEDASDTTLMLNDLLFAVPPSKTVVRYLVSFCIYAKTADTGAAPGLTPYVNGVAASSAIALNGAGSWYCSSSSTIDPAQYDMQYGENWEIGVTKNGNGDAANASFQLIWVIGG